jgi:outer membrane biosynthesis protein TonB
LVALAAFLLIGWAIALVLVLVTAVADAIGKAGPGARVAAPIRLAAGALIVIFVGTLGSPSSAQQPASASARSTPSAQAFAAIPPEPVATATPEPTASPTPTPTPSPTPTPTPEPTPSPTSRPTPKPTPRPTPKPAKATSNCHPSYKGVCLKDGIGDYDCAGGSGDGPNYVDGPFRVVGPDEFRLDSNHDGIACENG